MMRERLAIVAVAVAVFAGGVVCGMDTVMAVLLAGLLGARMAFRDGGRASHAVTVGLLVWAVALPLMHDAGGGFIDDATLALAYTVMALGLNIIVGFAGLLDLGYVAFFALGALTAGWFMSSFLALVNDGKGIHVLVSGPAVDLPGVHLNFLLVLLAAVAVCAVAGMIIGLPTLRLRGDYIAIVTLAFGEIIGRFVLNGDEIRIDGQPITNSRQGITPIDKIDLPFLQPFGLFDLRPWYWLALALVLIAVFVSMRLRKSRLGRAWVAIREDEIAASAMGIPLVRTKLIAYGTGAAFGGISGAFLASYLNTVTADQFKFSFSIFVLAMVILGGLGSVWGVVLGAITLSLVNSLLIPDVLNGVPATLGLDFDLTELSFGIFGFLLVIMMLLRPEGLFPERGHRVELEGAGTGERTREVDPHAG